MSRGRYRFGGSLSSLSFEITGKGSSVKITKLEAASWQLEVAIRLFLEGDYLASLTLAGAADEILGCFSARAGMPSAMDAIIDFHWDDTDTTLLDKKREQVLRGIMNSARNQAKHANDASKTHLIVEQISPLQMIMRSMPMAKKLGVPIRNETAMMHWIKENPEALNEDV